jgi:glycerol uptake facilitator-like aquaporin
MKHQPIIAEFVGTFLLALALILSIDNAPFLATPLVVALTLGVLVYALGPISGTHINPAVTIGLASVRAIEINQAIAYIVAQILGGLAAAFVAQFLVGFELSFALVQSDPFTLIAEAMGAAMLVFGISSVVAKKTPAEASGLVIGGSLLIGIVLASYGSAGILNPALAIAAGSLSVDYILGPVIGGVLAAWGYRAIAGKKK